MQKRKPQASSSGKTRRRDLPPGPAGLHPRNLHQGRYDFEALVGVHPALAPFLVETPTGDTSIPFADPHAVKALNRALLALHYGIAHWDIPAGYLCPPVPGRADCLHHLADLLAEGGPIPTGPGIRILDIGTGANLIYPLVGHRAYGWRFVGTDIDQGALTSARRILESNGLQEAIELRRQGDPTRIFDGVTAPGERFAACLCNPPFHASAAEAEAGSSRKCRNLGQTRTNLNFGGRARELWCPGGEVAFIRQMIEESRQRPGLCTWFTTLVARSAHLPALERLLGDAEVRVLPMGQGQKQSRLLAWRFR